MNITKKVLFLLLSLLTCVVVSTWVGAELWDNPGFEDEPANTDPLSEADDRMREIKIETRRRNEVEHWFGAVGNPAGDDDNGLHRMGSARVFLQDAAPTALDGGAGDYDPTADTEQAVTDLNDSASNSGMAAADDVGNGREWIDSNSDPLYQAYVYVGEAGDNTPAAAADGWNAISVATGHGDDEILAGSYNLVYNGSFEATDGTGDDASTTLPSGWTDGGTVCTHGYDDPTGDADYGDGYDYKCSGAGGASAFIYQRLTNLPANQVFKVIARAKDDGTTVCRLDTDGAGGADMADDDTTTDDWETLSGTFSTGAALDTVDIRLTRVTDNQVCLWDNVAVYRIGDVDTDRDEVSNPGTVAMYDTYLTSPGAAVPDASGADVPSLEVQFTPPGPGWILQVGYEISAGGGNDAGNLACFLKVGGVIVNGTAHIVSGDREIGETPPYVVTESTYVNINPVPGTTLVYTVDCNDGGFGSFTFNPSNSDSSLWMIAIAPR